MGKPSGGEFGPPEIEEHEPSAEKDCIVIMTLALETPPAIVAIFVDGHEITTIFHEAAGTIRIPVTFPVPAKSKWKWKTEGGKASAFVHSYTFLG